jgi:uncharacterized protein YecE (DUF72 family)
MGRIEVSLRSNLRIGTCSWKYPSWEGLVYSKAEGIDYLAEYARMYSTVEIDQWFWRMPEPAAAAEYASAVPKDFRFTIKIPNRLSLTHSYKKNKDGESAPNPDFLSPEVFLDFLSRLDPLKDLTGCLMLQFEYLNKKKMGSKAEFLSRLGSFIKDRGVSSALKDWAFAVEIRNPNWLDIDYFDFLASHRIGNVFLQGYYMPPVVPVYKKYADSLKGTCVVRLHGPDRAGMEKLTGEKWDAIVAPKDAELPGIADMTKDMLSRGLVVYLNVNNHYEGSGPLTIEKLRKALGVKRPGNGGD